MAGPPSRAATLGRTTVPIHRSSSLVARERLAVRASCLAAIAGSTLLFLNVAGAEPSHTRQSLPTAWIAPEVERATPAELQSLYLDCDRMAMSAALDFGSASYCSIVYETLKATVFGGSFERLLAWDRAQRDARAARN
jgi:hypothetical protein